MDHKVVVEGMEDVIERDLLKHQGYLAESNKERLAFLDAEAHERNKAAHYKRMIGKGKFNDVALQKSISDIRINIRHMQDRAKVAHDRIEHETLIVETLTQQLESQYDGLKSLAQARKEEHGSNH